MAEVCKKCRKIRLEAADALTTIHRSSEEIADLVRRLKGEEIPEPEMRYVSVDGVETFGKTFEQLAPEQQEYINADGTNFELA